jgi:hypothetical protein
LGGAEAKRTQAGVLILMSFTDEDALEYYTTINALVTKHLKDKNGRKELDFNSFWSEVLSLTADKIREKMNEVRVDLLKCGVDYIDNPTEYRGWNISLMVMSWLLYDLRNKTQNGHCHIHELPCKSGSESHNKMYMECLKSFKNILESFEKNTSKPVTTMG